MIAFCDFGALRTRTTINPKTEPGLQPVLWALLPVVQGALSVRSMGLSPVSKPQDLRGPQMGGQIRRG